MGDRISSLDFNKIFTLQAKDELLIGIIRSLQFEIATYASTNPYDLKEWKKVNKACKVLLEYLEG